MKRSIGIALCAALALAVLVPSPALAIGQTAAGMHPKSPLRFVAHTYNFSTTAAVTAATIGVCPPGGAVLKDVVYGQNEVGVGGTSWTATPKKNGTALVSTPGGFTLAAGAHKATNAAKAAIALTNPTGGTRPVLDAAQVKCAGGDLIEMDVALSGSYSSAVTGSVVLLWEPLF